MNAMATERIVLAGVDEAGLGPLLGSLAIGYVLLEVPAREPEPWKRLRGTVAKTPGAKARVVVADSKVLFQRNPAGEKRLETTVLSFDAQKGARSAAREAERFLFGTVSPAPEWRALPWRADLPALPRACTSESLELSSAVLARALARAEIELLDAGVRLVPAAELNASYEETSNKANSVWEKVLEVLRHVWAHRVRGPVRATVDMLGGRRRYGSLLGRAFPEASVKLVDESVGRSSYHLAAKDRRGEMQLEFRVKADRRCFEVALASCYAKYARELEVHAFNRYFGRFQPGLAPTAGYRGDGRRWLEDAELALRESGIARAHIVRTR